MLRLAVVLALLSVAFCEVRYDNFKVYEVYAETDAERYIVNHLDTDEVLAKEIPGLDVWRRASRGHPAHISVAPEHQAAFLDKLNELRLNSKVVVENVQDQLDDAVLQAASVPMSQRSIKNSYYNTTANWNFIWELHAEFSHLMAIKKFGESNRGNPLYFVRLSSERYPDNNPNSSKKPVIWIEATTHAREWLTNACALNLIEWLVKNYGYDSDASFLLDWFDWFIVPLHNPDGYDITHTTDRYFRKIPSYDNQCSSGYGRGDGVDPNRNWGYQFRVPTGSTDRCSASYQGQSNFSEPETSGLAEQMALTPAKHRRAFLSLHTYSQMILVPWGYHRTASKPNAALHRDVAEAARDAIVKAGGPEFEIGRPGDLLSYTANGGAYDYALGELEFDVALTYELHPGRNQGYGGFVWDPRNITDAFNHFLASVVGIADKLHETN